MALLIGYNKKAYLANWTDVSVTRSCETCPSTFTITCSQPYPGSPAFPAYKENDQVYITNDGVPLMTGYVDTVSISVSATSHDIQLTGRSIVEDLVDSSNLLLTNATSAASAYALAVQIASKFNITVVNKMKTPGPPIPPVPIQLTSTAYELIEFYSRYAGALVYDDPLGRLVLATVSTTKAAGSIAFGNQIMRCSFSTSSVQRYCEYDAVWSATAVWQDAGLKPPMVTARGYDPEMQATGRTRTMVFVADQFDFDSGQSLSQKRANFEASRRYGRSKPVKVTLDTWVDQSGKLWQVNTLVTCNLLPWLGGQTNITTWLIVEVTYNKSLTTGTTADLTLYPPSALTPEPLGLTSPLRDVTNPSSTASTPTPAKPAPATTTSGTQSTRPVPNV